MALTNKLTAIADAIREKNGTTELLKLDDMPIAIAAIETGGGGEEIPEEVLTVTGDCTYRFSYNGWNNFIEHLSDKITTEDITNCYYMFYGSSNLTAIPLKLNSKPNTTVDTNYMFQNCNNLKELPEIGEGFLIKDPQYLLHGCWNIRNADDFFNAFDYSYFSSNTNRGASIFANCRSLRSVPYVIFRNAYPAAAYNRNPIDGAFMSCYALDEIINLPLPYTATWTSNAFSSTFNSCYRVKNITFEVNSDGTPKVMNWKNQTISLDNYNVGYGGIIADYTGYNSGITEDKRVADNITYDALKNDPDWFTTNMSYSRYNHDSAVATINSLPDTSAYLATAGGTNTIKFKGAAGSLTDGGAIDTLTEEEIAVATAKGWTVTLA